MEAPSEGRLLHYLYLPIDFGAHFARSAASRAAASEFESWTAQSVRFLDRVVQGRNFLVGDHITIADVFAFGALDYGICFTEFTIAEGLENLRSWYSSMAARPSAQA